jgi:hypothetical protein
MMTAVSMTYKLIKTKPKKSLELFSLVALILFFLSSGIFIELSWENPYYLFLVFFNLFWASIFVDLFIREFR